MAFNATDELLIRGTGAARDGDREQARFFLDWVLRDDPTPEQSATAWYWLSRIADDPAEQRRCLEQVLALDPLHPEARRDLALLDGRLQPEEVIDPNRPLAPLTLTGQADPERDQPDHCPRCGAGLRFSVRQQALACPFCGYRASPDQHVEVDEQDWFAAAHTARGHRWVLPSVLTLTCQTCGAAHTLPPGQFSSVCPFCASPHLVQLQAERELMAPDGIVPFAVDEDAARRRLQQWQAAHRPAEGAAGVRLRPIYLPFWSFDVEAEITWRRRGDDGAHSGRAEGSQPCSFDDLLVPATQSLPEEVLTALRFDTAHVLPYADSLLAGWPAELYRVPVTDASLRARQQARARCQEQLATHLAPEGEPVTSTGIRLGVTTYTLLLLPVWVATADAGDRRLQVVINGQTGALHPPGEPGLLARVLDWLTGGGV